MWPNRALLLRAHVGTFSIYSLLLAKTNPPLIYRSWQTSVSSYPLEPLEIKFKSVWSDHGFDVLRFLQNEKQNLDRPYVGTFRPSALMRRTTEKKGKKPWTWLDSRPLFFKSKMKWAILGLVTATEKVCRPDRRMDCAPDQQITEDECLKRNCCWYPLEGKFSRRFFNSYWKWIWTLSDRQAKKTAISRGVSTMKIKPSTK